MMPQSPMPEQPLSTEPSDLQQVPLEELERMIMDRASALETAIASQGGGGLPGGAAPAGAPADAAAGPMIPDVTGSVEPQSIKSASAVLVESGLLSEATDVLTPELLNVLMTVADINAPGLYDLSNPEHIRELIDGISTGLFSLEPQQPAGPAPVPGPTPGGGGLPGSAGLPGGGVQPLPGEYPSGLPRGGAF